ncbi:hypothetical protein GXW74_17180 [Roseomonas eburnea]|uniref:Uncharacterized protein n=1 Tax=Neoroseomonas eburnea TaxID=1346889 RepID=A0A9X9XEU1_9PROT|nr:hypothetical protein [Neoroseomonas eburnea]MBR0682227.1 hypothetical protein [Neoroseomonas eburnea]
MSAEPGRDALVQMEGPLRNVPARLQFISDAFDGADVSGGEGLQVLIFDCLDDAAQALEQWKVAFHGAPLMPAEGGSTAAGRARRT